MSRPLSFRRDPAAASALLTWHAALQHDPGARARLRRAPTPVEVCYEPAFHRLLHALSAFAPAESPEARLAVAAVAGLAARVREHVRGPSVASQMAGGGHGEGTAAVSENRFRRLLTVGDPAERFAHLARIVALLGGRIDLLSLADAAYRWDDQIRQAWAYDYYAKAPATARP